MQRKQYSSALKAKIVIEALRETKTVAELASEHQIHPNLISKWKRDALEGLPSFFDRGRQHDQMEQEQQQKIEELYQEIGRLTTQVSWLKKKSGLKPDA
jgi:transposase-like protein